MNDVDESLKIYSSLLGEKGLSDYYQDKLSSLGLNEDDGYLIKFQIQLEIIKGLLKANDIIHRVDQLTTVLSSQRIHEDTKLIYGSDLLTFMINQTDNKIECDTCGTELLFIDDYCYNCGKKINHSINIVDLDNFVNSENIKIGDLLQFNENGIERTTVNTNNTISSLNDSDQLELSYTDKLNRIALENKYFKVILLDYIKNNESLKNFDFDNYKNYTNVSSKNVLDELFEEGMLSSSIKNKVNTLSFKFKKAFDLERDLTDISNNIETFNITVTGLKFINDNFQALFYDKYINQTVVDDILVFEEFFEDNKSENVMDTLIQFVTFKQNILLENFNLDEFYQSCNVEAYIYENIGKTDKQIIALLKRFISTLNLNLSIKRNPFDNGFIDFLNNTLISLNININQLKQYFHDAYLELPQEKLLFSEEKSFNFLLRCFNSENVNYLNFELIKLVK